MFAVGARAGAVTAAIPEGNFAISALAAAVTAMALLTLVRPGIVRRLHAGAGLKHGPALLVGTTGFAVEQISAQGGLVKLGGEVWTARPYDEHVVIQIGRAHV